MKGLRKIAPSTPSEADLARAAAYNDLRVCGESTVPLLFVARRDTTAAFEQSVALLSSLASGAHSPQVTR